MSGADTASGGTANRVGLTFDEIADVLRDNVTDDHRIGRCDLCGAPSMIANTSAVRDKGRPCRLTLGCKGKHRHPGTTTNEGLPH